MYDSGFRFAGTRSQVKIMNTEASSGVEGWRSWGEGHLP